MNAIGANWPLIAWTVLGVATLGVWVYLMFGRGRFWLTRERDDLNLPFHMPRVWPSVVAIVPARNEADVVVASIAGLMAQNYSGPFRVALVDDNSTDGTGEAARGVADERLEVITGAPLPAGWTGKLWAQQQGLAWAKALNLDGAPPRYVWLTDADIAHDTDTLRTLIRRAEDGDLVLSSLMAKLSVKRLAEKLLIPAFVFFFDMLYPFAWVNDPDRPTAAAAGGCMLARLDALEDAGGLGAISGSIIDDCALARIMKRQGPIWLGLTERSRSLRPYGGFGEIGAMVARSAYAQLGFNPLLLVGTVLAMALVFLAAPVLTFAAIGPARECGILAWVLMALAYEPMLRHYKVSPLWAFAMPLIGLFYTAFTVRSAIESWTGRGGLWKGRIAAPSGGAVRAAAELAGAAPREVVVPFIPRPAAEVHGFEAAPTLAEAVAPIEIAESFAREPLPEAPAPAPLPARRPRPAPGFVIRLARAPASLAATVGRAIGAVVLLPISAARIVASVIARAAKAIGAAAGSAFSRTGRLIARGAAAGGRAVMVVARLPVVAAKGVASGVRRAALGIGAGVGSAFGVLARGTARLASATGRAIMVVARFPGAAVRVMASALGRVALGIGAGVASAFGVLARGTARLASATGRAIMVVVRLPGAAARVVASAIGRVALGIGAGVGAAFGALARGTARAASATGRAIMAVARLPGAAAKVVASAIGRVAVGIGAGVGWAFGALARGTTRAASAIGRAIMVVVRLPGAAARVVGSAFAAGARPIAGMTSGAGQALLGVARLPGAAMAAATSGARTRSSGRPTDRHVIVRRLGAPANFTSGPEPSNRPAALPASGVVAALGEASGLAATLRAAETAPPVDTPAVAAPVQTVAAPSVVAPIAAARRPRATPSLMGRLARLPTTAASAVLAAVRSLGASLGGGLRSGLRLSGRMAGALAAIPRSAIAGAARGTAGAAASVGAGLRRAGVGVAAAASWAVKGAALVFAGLVAGALWPLKGVVRLTAAAVAATARAFGWLARQPGRLAAGVGAIIGGLGHLIGGAAAALVSAIGWVGHGLVSAAAGVTSGASRLVGAFASTARLAAAGLAPRREPRQSGATRDVLRRISGVSAGGADELPAPAMALLDQSTLVVSAPLTPARTPTPVRRPSLPQRMIASVHAALERAAQAAAGIRSAVGLAIRGSGRQAAGAIAAVGSAVRPLARAVGRTAMVIPHAIEGGLRAGAHAISAAGSAIRRPVLAASPAGGRGRAARFGAGVAMDFSEREVAGDELALVGWPTADERPGEPVADLLADIHGDEFAPAAAFLGDQPLARAGQPEAAEDAGAEAAPAAEESGAPERPAARSRAPAGRRRKAAAPTAEITAEATEAPVASGPPIEAPAQPSVPVAAGEGLEATLTAEAAAAEAPEVSPAAESPSAQAAIPAPVDAEEIQPPAAAFTEAAPVEAIPAPAAEEVVEAAAAEAPEVSPVAESPPAQAAIPAPVDVEEIQPPAAAFTDAAPVEAISTAETTAEAAPPVVEAAPEAPAPAVDAAPAEPTAGARRVTGRLFVEARAPEAPEVSPAAAEDEPGEAVVEAADGRDISDDIWAAIARADAEAGRIFRRLDTPTTTAAAEASGVEAAKPPVAEPPPEATTPTERKPEVAAPPAPEPAGEAAEPARERRQRVILITEEADSEPIPVANDSFPPGTAPDEPVPLAASADAAEADEIPSLVEAGDALFGRVDLSSGKGARDENFPVASNLIAPRHRPIVMAFYKVARMADDIADHPSAAPDDKLARLAAIERSLTGADDSVPQAVALRHALIARRLSDRHALDLLEAFRRDVTKSRYANWPELMDYCRYSAAPVGRFVLDVHGESEDRWVASDALCAALQVINHLQDCGKDYRELDRVYVPADALAAVGVEVGVLGARRASPALKSAIAGLALKTVQLLDDAWPLAGDVKDRRLALEIGVIHRLATGLNWRLTHRDPLSQRVHHYPWEAFGGAVMGARAALGAKLARR